MTHTFQIFKNCVFCDTFLTEERSGQGEHIIPRNIYGFWKSYDICDECKQHFGDNIDNLGKDNPNILEAMHALNLPNADTYYNHLKYQGVDTETGEKTEMVRKKGKFITKVVEKNIGFFQHAEKDMEFVGFDWLRKKLRFHLLHYSFFHE